MLQLVWTRGNLSQRHHATWIRPWNSDSDHPAWFA